MLQTCRKLKWFQHLFHNLRNLLTAGFFPQLTCSWRIQLISFTGTTHMDPKWTFGQELHTRNQQTNTQYFSFFQCCIIIISCWCLTNVVISFTLVSSTVPMVESDQPFITSMQQLHEAAVKPKEEHTIWSVTGDVAYWSYLVTSDHSWNMWYTSLSLSWWIEMIEPQG